MLKKQRILFVDDEINVLNGLRRMLRNMREHWDMAFAQNGEEALQLLRQRPMDVVVSDMRMPGMSGAELLEKVMELYPRTVRIVLSGHSDREMIMKSVRSAHRYLAKPCDAETIKSAVSRSCGMRDMLANEEMKTLVSSMNSLPSLPTLYIEIMNELQSRDASIQNVGEIIARDIGMSAKILQLINSAFFGLPRHVTSPAQAVALIGLETVQSLVLAVQIFSEFDRTVNTVSLETLWKHSERTGHFAQQIFKTENNDKQLVSYALIAGFLHDIGKLIFMTNFPDRYQALIDKAAAGGEAVSVLEKQEFGGNHGEVGAYLLNLWGLPDLVVEAIAYHNHPGLAAGKTFSPLMAVHVADALDHEMCKTAPASRVSGPDREYIRACGMEGRLAPWRSSCEKYLKRGEE